MIPKLSDDLEAGLARCRPMHGVGWVRENPDGPEPLQGCALGVALVGAGLDKETGWGHPFSASGVYHLLAMRYDPDRNNIRVYDVLHDVESLFEGGNWSVPEIIANLRQGGL